jgi:hypothetical protein
MRIKLSNSRLFFDEILNKGDTNLKQFSKKTGLNYSNLKQYRRGDKLLPDKYFRIIINYSPNKYYWLKNNTKFNDNWGGVKGGVNAARRADLQKRLFYVRSFRKIVKVNISKPNKLFCEFYGMLLGDGCITHYQDNYEHVKRTEIVITCNKNLDAEYLKNWKKVLNKRYNLNAYYYESKKHNVCWLKIRNKELCLELNKKFDVPIGFKYNKLKLSPALLRLSWNVKKYIIRGLLDTDGCILANKRENYRYPWITITSKSERFRNQIIKMLREQGYPAYNTGQDVCVRGIANVNRWFRDIGSSNSRNLLKYQYFLKHGYLPARLLTGPVL